MPLKEIDAKSFRVAFISGANNLSNHKEIINELNVFPVPDGDTGTNMTLTIMSAAQEVRALEDPDMDDMGKAIASGSLRGARGNSGVILSQILRGFCKDIKGKKVLTAEDLASAFSRAVETAYKAVMKPKEGTILTVAKGIAEKAYLLIDTEDDIAEFLAEVVKHGDEVLANTPNQLPVLKEAGVVDSGGQGLMEFIRGIYLAIIGQPVSDNDAPVRLIEGPKKSIEEMRGSSREDISTADIKFTYCTEFICNLKKPLTDADSDTFRDYLLSIGDSLVFVSDDEIVKIHVHTNHPGQAFEKAIEYGFLTNMKIDNMKEEHSERVMLEQSRLQAFSEAKPEAPEEKKAYTGPKKQFGFVAVASGDGIAEIFKGAAVDYVISGGQTMNPSTDDFLKAAEEINAEVIFLLPNNKNIILAANQAANLSKDKRLYVVPTKSVPQGISAMLAFSLTATAEENLQAMSEAAESIISGEVTYAVRDTSINGTEIKKDDIMGISDKGISSVGSDVETVALELIDSMIEQGDDPELISIYYGSDIDKDTAEALVARLEEKNPDIDVELQMGGQPIYYYLISAE